MCVHFTLVTRIPVDAPPRRPERRREDRSQNRAPPQRAERDDRRRNERRDTRRSEDDERRRTRERERDADRERERDSVSPRRTRGGERQQNRRERDGSRDSRRPAAAAGDQRSNKPSTSRPRGGNQRTNSHAAAGAGAAPRPSHSSQQEHYRPPSQRNQSQQATATASGSTRRGGGATPSGAAHRPADSLSSPSRSHEASEFDGSIAGSAFTGEAQRTSSLASAVAQAKRNEDEIARLERETRQKRHEERVRQKQKEIEQAKIHERQERERQREEALASEVRVRIVCGLCCTVPGILIPTKTSCENFAWLVLLPDRTARTFCKIAVQMKHARAGGNRNTTVSPSRFTLCFTTNARRNTKYPTRCKAYHSDSNILVTKGIIVKPSLHCEGIVDKQSKHMTCLCAFCTALIPFPSRCLCYRSALRPSEIAPNAHRKRTPPRKRRRVSRAAATPKGAVVPVLAPPAATHRALVAAMAATRLRLRVPRLSTTTSKTASLTPSSHRTDSRR